MASHDRLRSCRLAGVMLGALWLGSCGGGGAEPPALAGPEARSNAAHLPPDFADPAAPVGGVVVSIAAWPVAARHASLTPDGHVLSHGPDPAAPAASILDVWDPTGDRHLALEPAIRSDLACASHVMLGDGRSIALLGVGRADDALAAARTRYDALHLIQPAERRTAVAGRSQRERRCASAIALPDGSIYIQGGGQGPGPDGEPADRPEVRSFDGRFQLLPDADTGWLDGHLPRNFVAPGGGVFGIDRTGAMYHVDPTGGGTVTPKGRLGTHGTRHAAAMFAPGRILLDGAASGTALVIDIDREEPAVESIDAPARRRDRSMATILADGQVLASGGSDGTDAVADELALWHPSSRRWNVGARPAGSPGQPGQALLLPDATVLMIDGSESQAPAAPVGAAIYHPPYLFTPEGRVADRPALTSAPPTVEPGRSASVSVSTRRPISRITLVRAGAVSLGFDAGQRFVDLPFSRHGDALQVQLPDRSSDVPPGTWMMFAIDELGVPSKARLIRVDASEGARAADTALRPVLAPPGNQESRAGAAVRWQAGATDPNRDRLLFSASGLPAGLSIDPDSGVISGAASVAGMHTVVLAVSDGVHSTTSIFSWRVTGTSASTSDPPAARASAPAAAARLASGAAAVADKRALSSHQACAAPANAVVAENCLPGNPASEWDISGAGSSTIQGFATDISVNRGTRISFKVSTPASSYRYDIYRMGYYGGLGARQVATVLPSVPLPQSQPSCINQAATGLIDCGNWAVSGYWDVPAGATSGIYFARLVRTDGSSAASHIVFIVRDDASRSDLLFQTADTTWQAYNNYGGNSLYVGSPAGRAYKVSYNRPFNTRAVDGGQDWVFNAEYPMVRWLEANGYDVSYISGIDTDRSGSLLLNHRVFLSVGHDEYWSGAQRTNVEAARGAGVHLAFFSGNEVFWKTRWENSIAGPATAYRTLVTYKETLANAKIDPSPVWTGTWRDPRFSPPADGARPENGLTGTWFRVNAGTLGITVTAADGKMRLWRNTSMATLAAGASASLPHGTLGYEWDSDEDNGFRPPGLIRLSTTAAPNVQILLDHGSSYGSGSATHSLTLYRHASGARIFGAGTLQWSWGLDAMHDRSGTPSDVRMRQATVNLLADMDAQPATLQAGLVPAAASTDGTPPTSAVTSPAAGSVVASGSAVTVSGSAADAGGGVVGGVEVSVDGGVSWHPASGRGSWTYSWTPSGSGPATIRTRAADDSGNLETPGSGVTVNIGTAPPQTCPCTIWPASAEPAQLTDNDPAAVNLGTRFRSDVAGHVTAIRFYKGPGNTGIHRGALWTAAGQLLASVTFGSESASGWQQADLASPVAITANTVYVVSYHAPNGQYSGDDGYFASAGFDNPPLHALRDGTSGANGLYLYGSSLAFPTQTYRSENYWVDVVLATSTPADTTPPVVQSTVPADGASAVARSTTVSATFSEPMDAASIKTDNFSLSAPSGASIGASVAYNGTSRSATLTPHALLDAATTYRAWIGTGVRDLAGNPMATERSWSFTTAAPDTTAPTVSAITPANGASAVGRGVNVTATFSEAMDPATIGSTTFELRNPAGALVSAVISYNATSRVATLNPNSNLAARTSYTATVRGGAAGPVVRDLAGNALAVNRGWSFTTR